MSWLKNQLQQAVINQIDLSKEVSDDDLLVTIDQVLLLRSRENYISMQEKKRLRKEIFNAIRKLDILQDLIDDSTITEIMVNGHNQIFIEKNGAITKTQVQFESEEKLQDVVQQIVSQSNRIVNESNPIVDARLSDGSRVNIVLPPVALEGPVITIRKFSDRAITMEDLIEYGSITIEVAEFLKKLVVAGYNIFISGGTGSGKTTFLNVLSNFIPQDERIITIEDSAELQIKNIPNLVRLEVRNANSEGSNEITIRDLIKSALRMRPDRIIVGEVRDAAAIDMLQALNTGHDGSLSTGHANSPMDMLYRLETLVLMGSDIPLMAVRRQISSAIDIVVQLGRLRDKSRRVLEIVEVLDTQQGEFHVNTLFRFQESDNEGENSSKISGQLLKENPLINKDKLIRAGLLGDGSNVTL